VLFLFQCGITDTTDTQNNPNLNGDKKRLIGIILNGMEGDIEVDGRAYNEVMPTPLAKQKLLK